MLSKLLVSFGMVSRLETVRKMFLKIIQHFLHLRSINLHIPVKFIYLSAKCMLDKHVLY